jgi:serine/threonine protein kinase
MLDAAGILKISDFGLCSVYKLKESGKTRLLSERCGSLPYIAPEVSTFQSVFIFEVSAVFKLAGNAPYKAEPIDVWGIGVILFTMLVGSESPPSIVGTAGPNPSQTRLGTNHPRIASNSVPSLVARSSIRTRGTDCPQRCLVRRFIPLTASSMPY